MKVAGMEQHAESPSPWKRLSHIYALCRFIIDSLSRPLGALHISMCKGERVKQLQERVARRTRRGASRQLDPICYLVKCKRNFIITIEGNAACVCGWACVCTWVLSLSGSIWRAASGPREFIAFH